MSSDTFEPIFSTGKIGRQIGSGSYGKVYRLCDEQAEKPEVVKIVRLNHDKIIDTNTTDKSFQSFSKEDYCDAFVKNITDNIELVHRFDKGSFFADCYDWETHQDVDRLSTILYIRMEQLTPLSDFINEFTFSEAEVLRLAICLCRCLDKCRDFGFVYPNLKPENVLFDSVGRCKLGDFNTFCCTGPQKNSIAYKRTLQYMSPEFYKQGVINDTCDTYSLGLLMYALLNKGRLPFMKPYPAEVSMNDTSQAMRRRIGGEPIPTIQHVAEELQAIIMKAISFQKDDRYLSPRQMLSDLTKLVNEDIPDFEEPKPEKELPDSPQEYVPVQCAKVEFPKEPEDFYLQYEKKLEGMSFQQEPIKAESASTIKKKPNLSNVMTYNYDDRSVSGLGKLPRKFLIILIAAITVVCLTVLVLTLKYIGQEKAVIGIPMFSGEEISEQFTRFIQLLQIL